MNGVYLRILQKRQCSPSLECYIAKIHGGKTVIFKMGFVLPLYIIMKKNQNWCSNSEVSLKSRLKSISCSNTKHIGIRVYTPKCLSEYLKYILNGALPVD